MEEKTRKRPDAKQRKEGNKAKDFVSVKMKWNKFCINEGIRKGILPIIENCNKIVYNSYHLANVQFLYNLENNIELPDLDNKYFQKICASVSYTYNEKNRGINKNNDNMKFTYNYYQTCYPENYKLPSKDYLGPLINNIASDMAIASNNHIILNFGKRLMRYIYLKYKINNAWHMINNMFNPDLNYVLNRHESELKEWLVLCPKENIIKNNIKHFIKLSFEILKFMESQPPNTKGAKTFTILPNKSSFVNSYIRICSTCLREILKLLNQRDIDDREFAKEKDNVWRKLFNINDVETKTRSFNYEISTDGYGVSVLLHKKKNIKDIEDKDGKIKCGCGCMVYKKNMTNHKKTKEHKLVIDENTIPNNIIEETERYIGIDPGVSYIYTGYDNEDNYYMCSSKDYRNRSLITNASKWRTRQVKNTNIEQILKTFEPLKVSSSESYITRLKYIQTQYDTLVEFYNKAKSFAKWKFTTYIYSKKAIHKICKDLYTKNDKPVKTIIGLGDWSQQQGIIKRHPTTPIKRFKDELRRSEHCYVIDINEYRTSKECSICHSDVKNLKQYKEYEDNEKNIIGVKLSNCHQVVRCTNNECSMCWQRDKNASRNIYKKLQDKISSSTRNDVITT